MACAIERKAFQDREAYRNAEDYLAFVGSEKRLLIADDAISSGLVVLQIAADDAEVIDLGVVPAHRRCGLAWQLLAFAETVISQRGVVRMFLEVAVDNQAARSLYAKAGYNQIGLRPGYYLRPGGKRVDALVYSKNLTPPLLDI